MPQKSMGKKKRESVTDTPCKVAAIIKRQND